MRKNRLQATLDLTALDLTDFGFNGHRFELQTFLIFVFFELNSKRMVFKILLKCK